MAALLEQSTTWAGIGGSFTATLGAAPTEGNVLLAYLGQQSTNTWTMEAGWTLLTMVYQGDESAFAWKEVGASESATQTAATSNNTARNLGIWLAEFSGLDAAALVLNEDGIGDALATKTTPSVTPTAGQDVLIVCGGHSTAGDTVLSNMLVNGSATGVTEHGNLQAGTASNGVSMAMWSLPVASTSGSYSGTVDASVAQSGAALIVVLAVASGAENHTGSAALSGSGTLSAVGQKIGSGSVELSGSGTLSATGTPHVQGAVSLSGSGTLSAAGSTDPLATLVFLSDIHAGINTAQRLSDSASLALSLNPTRVILTGDTADTGISSEYAELDTNWGSSSMRAVLKVIPGNHDYLSDIEAGFGTYWGSNAFAGPSGSSPGYYGAEVIGGWHIIYLNLQSSTYYSAGSDQRVWLTNYLTEHSGEPMLAVWHYEPFSAAQMAPGHLFHATLGPQMVAIWDELAAAGCEVVVAGHDHSYQRFARKNSAGTNSATGMRSFVVAHANNNYLSANSPVDPTLPEAYNPDTAFLGVTKIDLYADHYDWAFVPHTGSGTTYTDSGTETTLNTVPSTNTGSVALSGSGTLTASGVSTFPVSAAISTSWMVAAEVVKAVSSPWHVGELISKAVSSPWHVGELIVGSRSSSWNVLSETAGAVSSQWHVREEVAGSRSSSWNVNQQILDSLSTTWHVDGSLAAVSKVLTSSWNVAAEIIKASSSDWHVREQISKASSSDWHVVAQVLDSLSTSWNVDGALAAVSRVLSTSWNIAGQIGSDRSSSWNVNETITSQQSSDWNVLETIAVAMRSSSWNVLEQVGASRSTSWGVGGAVARALGTSWNVVGSVSRALSTSWNTLFGLETPVVSRPKATLTLIESKAGITVASSGATFQQQ